MSDSLIAFAVSYAVIAVVVCAGAWWYVWRRFCDGEFETVSAIEVKDPHFRRLAFVLLGMMSTIIATSWPTVFLMFIIFRLSIAYLDPEE